MREYAPKLPQATVDHSDIMGHERTSVPVVIPREIGGVDGKKLIVRASVADHGREMSGINPQVPQKFGLLQSRPVQEGPGPFERRREA